MLRSHRRAKLQGRDKRPFSEDTTHSYSVPGVYTVALTVRDKKHRGIPVALNDRGDVTGYVVPCLSAQNGACHTWGVARAILWRIKTPAVVTRYGPPFCAWGGLLDACFCLRRSVNAMLMSSISPPATAARKKIIASPG